VRSASATDPAAEAASAVDALQCDLLPDLPAPPPVASGITGTLRDSEGSDAALSGDRYTWLTDLTPASESPRCERCRRLLVLPPDAPVIWVCPDCNPAEVGQ
jgi:hypothetical protein